MQFPSFLLRQLAQPHGWFAPVTAWLLNRANGDQNRSAIAALDLAPGHAVLDVGFGGGASLPALLRTCSEGKVAGIELAQPMVERARRIWSREIAAGRLQIEQGAVASLPWRDGALDRVLTVNTMYFWEDLDAGLREILRALATGGVFVSSVLPAETLTGWGYTGQGFRVQAPSFYAEALRAAGFAEVTVQDTGDKRDSIVVRGLRP